MAKTKSSDQELVGVTRSWLYFGFPVLLVGLIAVFTISQLEEKGITSWLNIGSLRLDNQEQQRYLEQANELPLEKLSDKLAHLSNKRATVNQQGVLTVNYNGTYLDDQTKLRNYKATKKVGLARLDQMVFTAPQSNSQKGRDRWSIRVFCLEKLACITEATKRGAGGEKNITASYDELIEIEGTDNARFALAILNRLIRGYGGKSELDQTKGVIHIYNEYKNN